MAKKQKNSSHKFGGRNNGPARVKYWALRVLEKNKIRNIRKATGLTQAEAYLYWHDARDNRRMKTK